VFKSHLRHSYTFYISLKLQRNKTRVYDEPKADCLEFSHAAIDYEEMKDQYAMKLRLFLKFASFEPDEFVRIVKKQPDKAEKLS
jgi:hypothetical protein